MAAALVAVVVICLGLGCQCDSSAHGPRSALRPRRRALEGAPGDAVVTTGAQFAAALADPSVRLLLLARPMLQLHDADFSAPGLPALPLPLTRNVTVTGLAPADDPAAWPLLDLNYVKDKVVLSGGAALVFTRLVLSRLAFQNPSRAAALDLVAPAPPQPGGASAGFLVLEGAAYVANLCYPAGTAMQSVSTMPRPLELPGPQLVDMFVHPSGCTNTTWRDSAWLVTGSGSAGYGGSGSAAGGNGTKLAQQNRTRTRTEYDAAGLPNNSTTTSSSNTSTNSTPTRTTTWAYSGPISPATLAAAAAAAHAAPASPPPNPSLAAAPQPPMLRCYAARGYFLDMALPASRVAAPAAAAAAPVPCWYGMVLTGSWVLCERLMDEGCIAKLGPLGCYLATVAADNRKTSSGAAEQQQRLGGNGLGAKAPGGELGAEGGGEKGAARGAKAGAGGLPDQGQAQGQGQHKPVVLGAVIGGVMGGVALLLLAAGLLLLRRRRRGLGHGQSPGGCAGYDSALSSGALPTTSMGEAGVGAGAGEATGGGTGLCGPDCSARGHHGSTGVDGDDDADADADVDLELDLELGSLVIASSTCCGGDATTASNHAEGGPLGMGMGPGSGAAVVSSDPHLPPPPHAAGALGTRAAYASTVGSSRAATTTVPNAAGAPSAAAAVSEAAPVTRLTPLDGSIPLGVGAKLAPEMVAALGLEPEPGTGQRQGPGEGPQGDCGSPEGGEQQQLQQQPQPPPPAEVELLPEVLGRGVSGCVVRGRYLGGAVAVKVVTEAAAWGGHGGGGGGGGALAAAFAREVEVLGRCRHPNVVRLLAACLTPPKLCLVLELMETSLDRVLYGGGGGGGGYGVCGGAALLPLEQVLHIGSQVALGLDYLHPTIVHRDIKPANVLLSGPLHQRPVVKLADFGVSRLRTSLASLTSGPASTPGLGTPANLGPEAFDVEQQAAVTHKLDMYSLGVLLWELLAGRRPWEGCNDVAVAVAVALRRQRLPLDILPPGRCPPRLRRLLAGCWEADPLRRPAAAEAAKALAQAAQELQLGCYGGGGAGAVSAAAAAAPYLHL